MTVEPVRLTREELFELVWSRPMTKIAEEFGMSSVAFAKYCKAADVPRPEPGSWRQRLLVPRDRARSEDPARRIRPGQSIMTKVVGGAMTEQWISPVGAGAYFWTLRAIRSRTRCTSLGTMDLGTGAITAEPMSGPIAELFIESVVP